MVFFHLCNAFSLIYQFTCEIFLQRPNLGKFSEEKCRDSWRNSKWLSLNSTTFARIYQNWIVFYFFHLLTVMGLDVGPIHYSLLVMLSGLYHDLMLTMNPGDVFLLCFWVIRSYRWRNGNQEAKRDRTSSDLFLTHGIQEAGALANFPAFSTRWPVNGLTCSCRLRREEKNMFLWNVFRRNLPKEAYSEVQMI